MGSLAGEVSGDCGSTAIGGKDRGRYPINDDVSIESLGCFERISAVRIDETEIEQLAHGKNEQRVYYYGPATVELPTLSGSMNISSSSLSGMIPP